MYNQELQIICLILAIGSTSNAFVLRTSEGVSFSLAASFDDNVKNNAPMISQPSNNKNSMSVALPFLKCPTVLAENLDVPGNVGFDPLGFVQDKDDLIAYQEAEIKHARLAMLVRFLFSTSKSHEISRFLKGNTLISIISTFTGGCWLAIV